MSKKRTKTLFNLLPILATSFLTIGSFTVSLSSCKKDEPQPEPEPVPPGPEPTETIKITFNAGEGTISGQHTISLDIPTDATWSSIDKPANPVWNNHPFLHWSLEKDGAIVPDDHTFIEGETIYAVYHTHDFNTLIVENDRLYWQCECGEKIALADEQLAVYDDKFLLKNGNTLIELETTSLSDIQKMYPEKSIFDVYVTKGDFTLSSETNGNVTFNFHGILNSKNEYNLNIQCGQVPWLTDKVLTFTNACMHGGTTGFLYDNGLHCADIKCNNCKFDGYQSIWASNTATFEKCTFDPTNTGEYIFYTYGSTREINITDCEFIASRKAIKVYRQDNAPLTLKFENTIFGSPAGVDPKAAIEVNSSQCGALSSTCEWNIYADDATIESIRSGDWNCVCRNVDDNDLIIHDQHVKFNDVMI